MNKLLKGALSGLAATVPMTGAMFLLHQQLPRREQKPLPPEDITGELSRRAGVGPLSQAEHQGLTWTAHFAFGAAMGAFYTPLAERVRVPPALKGAAFGLLVWAGSYLGWLPVAGILNQPKEQGARPNGLMIAAHLVWGAVLGMLAERDSGE